MGRPSKADLLLIRWGEWCRADVVGLGYPSKTTISRLTSSPGWSGVVSCPSYKLDPEAKRVDGVIKSMHAAGYDREVELLYLCFVERKPPRLAAEELGFPHSELYKVAVRKAVKVFEVRERKC